MGSYVKVTRAFSDLDIADFSIKSYTKDLGFESNSCL